MEHSAQNDPAAAPRKASPAQIAAIESLQKDLNRLEKETGFNIAMSPPRFLDHKPHGADYLMAITSVAALGIPLTAIRTDTRPVGGGVEQCLFVAVALVERSSDVPRRPNGELINDGRLDPPAPSSRLVMP